MGVEALVGAEGSVGAAGVLTPGDVDEDGNGDDELGGGGWVDDAERWSPAVTAAPIRPTIATATPTQPKTIPAIAIPRPDWLLARICRRAI